MIPQTRRRRVSFSERFNELDQFPTMTHRRRRRPPSKLDCWLCAVAVLSVMQLIVMNINVSKGGRKQSVVGSHPRLLIRLPITPTRGQTTSLHHPVRRKSMLSDSYYPGNYGGLVIPALSNDTAFVRTINVDRDSQLYEQERYDLLHAMRHGARSRLEHDEEQDRPRECERNNWRSTVYTNCNTFHELDMEYDELYHKKFLG
jgi:hypothetical protein